MKKILVVDSCVNRDTSRTERLLRALLERWEDGGEYVTERLVLEEEPVPPLTGETVLLRSALTRGGDLSHPMLRHAHALARADLLVFAAPYWDLQFPALLKAYLEAVCVCGITFRYTEEGAPVGMCRARKLWYVTTAGGYVGELNLGYDYLRALAALWGVPETEFLSAQGLDILGNDPERILEEAIERVRGRK